MLESMSFLKTAVRGSAAAAVFAMSSLAAAASVVSIGGYDANDQLSEFSAAPTTIGENNGVITGYSLNGGATVVSGPGLDGTASFGFNANGTPPGAFASLSYTGADFSTNGGLLFTSGTSIEDQGGIFVYLFTPLTGVTNPNGYEAIIMTVDIDDSETTSLVKFFAAAEPDEPPAIPLPAGAFLLLGGLGAFAFARRKLA
jgi:hypothetical protein